MRLSITWIIVLILGVWSCGKKTVTPPENKLGGHATYVGKEACGSCHQDKLNSFLTSEMGRSFKPATLSQSAAKWDDIKPVYDKHLDFWYLPFHKGEDLFIMEYRISGKDTLHKRIEKIDFIVGSGQHTNSHIMEENGYLYQIPLTWYAQDGKWDFPPGFENGNNSRFSRMIELECMTCHNAMPGFEKGSGNKFTMIPHGVDCERCHGPGSNHVERMKTGNITDASGQRTNGIVHPGKLSKELQFDICQRCHLQGTAVPVNGKSFADFEPGMRLNEVMDVFFLRKSDSLERFIMASHPDRLRQSKCFISSEKDKNSMTCITCHDPHKPIAALGAEYYNGVCQGCHTEKKVNLCSEKESVRIIQNDNCVHCHMPTSGSADIPHVRITDHYIRPVKKVPIDKLEQEKAYLRLVCRTQENPSAIRMAEGYLAYYEQFNPKQVFLDSAFKWIQKAKPVTKTENFDPVWVRYLYVSKDYRGLSEWAKGKNPEAEIESWTAYRIGESLMQNDNSKAAISWLKKAVDLSPKNLGFRNRYATALIKEKKIDEAIQLLDEMILDSPSYESSWNQRGFAYVLKDDLRKAEPDFRKAIALNPDMELALANLSSLLINTGRFTEAEPFVKRLIAINPKNENYQKLMKSVKG